MLSPRGGCKEGCQMIDQAPSGLGSFSSLSPSAIWMMASRSRGPSVLSVRRITLGKPFGNGFQRGGETSGFTQTQKASQREEAPESATQGMHDARYAPHHHRQIESLFRPETVNLGTRQQLSQCIGKQEG